MSTRTLVQTCPAIIMSLLFVASQGCGSSMPATVSGKVTLDGEAVKKTETIDGTIMFYPVSSGAVAYGTIDENGDYTMNTGSRGGLEPGEYIVTVRIVEIPPPPHTVAPENKLISPARYENREQSELRAEVSQGRNTIDLALTTEPT